MTFVNDNSRPVCTFFFNYVKARKFFNAYCKNGSIFIRKRLPEWINLNRLLDVVMTEDYNETNRKTHVLYEDEFLDSDEFCLNMLNHLDEKSMN